MNVLELIEILQKSLEEGSLKPDTPVLYSHFCNHCDGTEDYTFQVDFIWDTVEEYLGNQNDKFVV